MYPDEELANWLLFVTLLASLLLLLGHQKHEFVAAQSRDRVPFLDTGGQPLGGDLQQTISDVVAEGVVDQLEVVEIDERQAERPLVPVCQRQRLLQTVLEQVAVGETGELVVIRLMLELLLVAFDLGDVVLHADEVRDAIRSRVPHRRDVQLVPEKAAVLAIIA